MGRSEDSKTQRNASLLQLLQNPAPEETLPVVPGLVACYTCWSIAPDRTASPLPGRSEIELRGFNQHTVSPVARKFEKLSRIGSIFTLVLLISARVFPESDQSPAHREQPVKGSLTYSINVGLVVLPVTVLDKSGRFIPGLDEKDFSIYEDGVPQKIQVFDHQDIPVAVGLLIDNSSSMVPNRADVTAASLELAEASNPADQIFVVHFYDHIAFALKLGEAFTSDIEELRAAVSRIAGIGKTALYDAVIAGLDHLQQSDLPKRVLVIISDGGDNASDHTLKETLDMIAQSNALIYTIGIYNEHDRERNPKVLKQLSDISGGETYFPKSGSQLSEACKSIATDIRSQYTLGYIPSNQKKDGSYRKIRVSVNAPNLRKVIVRTRSGYIAPRRGPNESPESPSPAVSSR